MSLHSIVVESRKVKLPNNNPDQDEYLPSKQTEDTYTYILGITRRTINNARVVSVQEQDDTAVSRMSVSIIVAKSRRIKLPRNKPDLDELSMSNKQKTAILTHCR